MRIRPHLYRGDVWHRISSRGQPDRWFRLFKPSALAKLNARYKFIDGAGCLNEDGKLGQTTPSSLRYVRVLHKLDESTLQTHGAEQKTKYSGICWYCASLFLMFFSRQMRHLMLSKLDDEDAAFTVNILSSRANAEAFRRHMYAKYKYGDRPDQPEHMDGQNGFGQFCILASKLDIPLIRLFAPSMYELTEPVLDTEGEECTIRTTPLPGETSLLCIRCFRTKWVPVPRYIWKGRRYKIVGMFIGSEHCGHQIGASTCDMRACDWAVADSDASREGIGPMFWSLKKKKTTETKEDFLKRWQEMWGSMIPATKFQKGICDLNPKNRDTMMLQTLKHTAYRKLMEHGEEEDGVGVVNTDFLYIHIP